MSALCVSSNTLHDHTRSEIYTRLLLIFCLCHIIYFHVKMKQLQNNFSNLNRWCASICYRVAFLEKEYEAYIQDDCVVYRGPRALKNEDVIKIL